MASQIILHQPESEKIIRYSLNNSIPATEELYRKLIDKGFFFKRDHKINNYTFDFYSPLLKIAIEIDGYAHEFTDVYSQDAPKKLHIHSLGITVLRFTDYQILVDIEEIIRALKHQIKLSKHRKYVV
ncbi:endonuclease domain-containing protein [Aquimarina rubra]|uniref:Endonuclease domain-containing protein n=1 Tax=Aquimarina rubra TaxID=1920033 RepID=A0ABW5LH35_9FLAO